MEQPYEGCIYIVEIFAHVAGFHDNLHLRLEGRGVTLPLLIAEGKGDLHKSRELD